MARSPLSNVLGRGVYGARESLQLLNFTRDDVTVRSTITRMTLARWMRGYAFSTNGHSGFSEPLWTPDYANDDDQIELSFRDLIELRFVRAFRELGLSLPAIRDCFQRAVEEVRDPRPFSTRRFRTDGKTIFLEVTDRVKNADAQLIDLRRRQGVFQTIVAPSLKDLEFDAEVVARWYPLGANKGVVIDPTRSFGRAIALDGGVPTEVLATAVAVEGSIERAAAIYEVTTSAVRAALTFEHRLAA